MAFNIKSLAMAPTADMHICDANGEKQYDENGDPITITFHGPASKEYRKVKHENELTAQAQATEIVLGKKSALTWQDKADNRAEYLAKLTVSFNGFGDPDGGKLSGFQLFKKIYSDVELVNIADDAENFLNNRKNFTKPSAKK